MTAIFITFLFRILIS